MQYIEIQPAWITCTCTCTFESFFGHSSTAQHILLMTIYTFEPHANSWTVALYRVEKMNPEGMLYIHVVAVASIDTCR